MKTALQILLIAALIALGVIQILYAKGFFAKDELIQVCPVNAITMQNGKAVIDPDICIGCRRCVMGVPRAESQTSVPDESVVADTIITASTKEAEKAEASVKETKKPAPVLAQKTQKPKYKADPATCIGCSLCVENCPTQAITMVKDKAVIDNSKCIQCDICIIGDKADFAGCPVQAITKR